MSSTIDPFPESSLEAISKVLGDTDHGFTGTQIAAFLQKCGIDDVTPTFTKWQRLFNAFAHHQNATRSGAPVVAFIQKALVPVTFTSKPDSLRWFQQSLTPILAFSGLGFNESGRLTRVEKAKSLDDARARANRLKSELERRFVHPEVLSYCTEQLVQENCFHAVLEAMKGVAKRMQKLSGTTSDGAKLVQELFTLGDICSPKFAINPLTDESLQSEQKGFVNLLIGMFGMFRNPVAHAPKVLWKMSETDALDMLTTISLVHRKLDVVQPYTKR